MINKVINPVSIVGIKDGIVLSNADEPYTDPAFMIFYIGDNSEEIFGDMGKLTLRLDNTIYYKGTFYNGGLNHPLGKEKQLGGEDRKTLITAIKKDFN
jgi:hypothetical protein